MNRKTASVFSLCKRAGCLISGEQAAEIAIKDGEALLVIIADDASENTKKKFLNKSKYYKVNAVVYGRKEELSRAIGCFDRSVFAVVKNENFADKIYELITEENI